jgi:accessory Sec system S-layer assembly protein
MPLFSRKKSQSSTIDWVSQEDQLAPETTENQSEQTVQTELSIHPDWTLRPEQVYVFKFHNNMSAKLLPNQLSLYGIELEQNDEDGKVTVTALIRSSLNKPITLSNTSLLLMGPDNDVLGRKTFDLSLAGELPPNSSRPYYFEFEREDLTTESLPISGWKLAFELKRPHQLDLEESWRQTLADQDQKQLKQLVESLEAPKPGEVNFMGLQAKLADDGKLHVTLLIRNGSDKNLTIENLPLEVVDGQGEVVAQGGFSLNSLEVKGNTSKPWTFIFPEQLIEKTPIDLSKWTVRPIQKH